MLLRACAPAIVALFGSGRGVLQAALGGLKVRCDLGMLGLAMTPRSLILGRRFGVRGRVPVRERPVLGVRFHRRFAVLVLVRARPFAVRAALAIALASAAAAAASSAAPARAPLLAIGLASDMRLFAESRQGFRRVVCGGFG
jgi:hypothetical protein